MKTNKWLGLSSVSTDPPKKNLSWIKIYFVFCFPLLLRHSKLLYVEIKKIVEGECKEKKNSLVSKSTLFIIMHVIIIEFPRSRCFENWALIRVENLRNMDSETLKIWTWKSHETCESLTTHPFQLLCTSWSFRCTKFKN